ncbi:MAG: Holliday junction resolvase RuvX [Pseudomonadota bacterium]|nr:Holliday junction resolvase RuvX [Pseudomonadota bacterium]
MSNDILESLKDLVNALPESSRLLGLDVGSKTIGMAISDSNLKVATAIKTINRSKFREDIKKLKAEILHRSVGGIVIGLPISMNGSEGPACQSIRQFALNIAPEVQTNIAFWDERLSTSAIERFLTKEVDMSRRKRRQVVDKLAATYILQGAIDSLK